jgi:O-antigen/teichoic acid export membrane protein
MITVGSTREGTTTARSALASLGWNYGGSVVAVLMQLFYTAYTGRAVAPQSFGAYAIALTTVQFLGYFANAGMATCLLRAEQLTGPLVRAATYLGVASGVVCFTLVELAAPICGSLWRMPGLTAMLQVLGAQFLLMPAVSVAVSTLRRVGRARAAVTAELAGQLGGMGLGVALLASGWGALSLAATRPVAVAVTLIAGAIPLALQRLPSGPPVRTRDLFASSSFLTGYSLMEFVTNSAPLWAVARLLGPGAAGAYSRASLFTGLPVTFLAQGLSRTAVPMLAERRGRKLSLNRGVHHAVCTASAAAFVCFGAVAGVGPVALSVLLGQGWGAAAALVPLLAVVAACGLLFSTGSAIDQARGAPRAVVAAQLTAMATMVCAVAAAAVVQSLALMAAAAAVGQAAGHVVQLRRWHRVGLLRAPVCLRIHLVHIAVGGALAGAGALGGGLMRSPAAGFACGLLCMVPVVLTCVLLRNRLPLYVAAVETGLLRPRRDGAGGKEGTWAAAPGDPDGGEPRAAASSAT